MARHGTQISLDPERYQAVTNLAESQRRPVTEVVREVLDLGLEQVKRRRQRKIQALSELATLRHKLESRIGIYPGTVIGEVRAERERQVEAVLSRKDTKGTR